MPYSRLRASTAMSRDGGEWFGVLRHHSGRIGWVCSCNKDRGHEHQRKDVPGQPSALSCAQREFQRRFVSAGEANHD